MTDAIHTFCPVCDGEVVAEATKRDDHVVIRGERVEFQADALICPTCGAVIGDSRIEAKNLEKAYAAYRKAHDLVSSKEIADLRAKYGLSLREFSRFLGFGEQTVAKYESGSLPDDLHNNMVKMARTAQGARMLLDLNLERLSKSSIEKVERFISSVQNDSAYDTRWYEIPLYDEESAPGPSRKNGYRAPDMERMAALVVALAGKCTDLYKTKLHKAMFFCDSLSFERLGRSLTGLSYAHADFGPVMNDGDYLLARLAHDGFIRLRERDWGEVVCPLKEPSCLFSDCENDLIDEVARFVNSFTSASSISSCSHTLRAWKDTPNGRIIDYGKNLGEVSKTVEERLRA